MSGSTDFHPSIVGFLCHWCSYAGADLAGTSRIAYPEDLRVIRVMCSGRVDPLFILEAFLGGADGVVTTIFHASLIALCFQRAQNQTVRALTFDDLNHVSGSDREARLEKEQPALLGYIAANVESAPMRELLTLIALAMEWAT